jgi:general secretion pathway protein K
VWVIIILSALVLIFARSMKTEVAASGNRFSAQQADAIELGAEQFVLAATDESNGDAVTVLQTKTEQIPVGAAGQPSGYFWILQTYPENDYSYAFGITDESSKVNINFATANGAGLALANLPGMPQDVADSIVLWRGGAAGQTTGQGADTNYYQSLGRPYSLKQSPFETIDELFLVSHQDVTDQLMYGSDLDHNGMLDDKEQQAGGGLATTFNAASDTTRGIAPFITAWGGTEPNPKTTPTGGPRLNVTLLPPAGRQRIQAVTKALTGLPAEEITRIVRLANAATRFTSALDFAVKTQMTAAEFDQVGGNLTFSTQTVLNGLINVNTAPQQVLATLPGLTTDDAMNLANARDSGNSLGAGAAPSSTPGGAAASNSLTSYSWLLTSGLSKPQLSRIGQFVTGKSFYYSADIVAVSGEGRAFKRARIVVNARSSPPVIVYRKDLTYLGWPLSPDILTALRKGQPLPAPAGYGTGGGNGFGSL